MGFNFSTALSGLRASSNTLSVAGNNIANANTIAFKGSTISFADVFTNSLGIRFNGAGATLQIGNGVATAATTTNFSQGTLKDAASPTSAAIQGNGFFVVADNAGAPYYTRAGDFLIDRSGYFVTPNGKRVQGFAAVNGVVPPGTGLSSLRVPVGETTPPAITTQATLRTNLNSGDPAGSVFHSPVRVYDSKGVDHVLDLTFTKQANGSFLVNATLDGNPAQTSVDGAAGSGAAVPFIFDTSGTLTSPATSLVVLPDQTLLPGTTLPAITINLRESTASGAPGTANFTNYSTASAVSSTEQDGYAAGTLTGVSLSADQNGGIFALFSNGQKRNLGEMAVAVFSSLDGLRHIGGNQFEETIASGQPSVGQPGSGGRGTIIGGSTEESNVSIADEFTELIVAQRSFQANSRVITTISQTLQDLIQII